MQVINRGVLNVTLGEPGPSVAEYVEVAHDEYIPNPGYNPNAWTVSSGDWEDETNWAGQFIPTSTSRVVISHTITINDENAEASGIYIRSGGILSFAPDVDTELTVTTMLVDETGELEIGTEGDPIEADVTAKICIRNAALPAQETDPFQFSNGVLFLGNAICTIHGAVKTSDASSLRLAVEPLEGATTLTMAIAPSGWRIGDKVALAATDPQGIISTGGVHQLGTPYHGETCIIANIVGAVITLEDPLAQDHLGARDRNSVLDFLPHVINLTRNVVIYSENPAGVRGHVLFSGQVEVDVRYAAAVEIGRTNATRLVSPYLNTFDNTTLDEEDEITHYGLNHAGRYPWHFHHHLGPVNVGNVGYQGVMLGCVVDGGKKWGMAVHGTSYLRIEANNVWNCQAAGIAFEIGSEAYNLVEENVVFEIVGIPGSSAPGTGINPGDGTGTSVTNGYWYLTGGRNSFINNVAAGLNGDSDYLGHGFHLDGLQRGGSRTGGDIRFPLFRGADTMHGAEGVDYELLGSNSTLYTEFDGNETYGTWKGFSQDHYGLPNFAVLTYTDCVCWNLVNESWFIYGATGGATLIRPTVRNSMFALFSPNSNQYSVITVIDGDFQSLTGIGVYWGGDNANQLDDPNELILDGCIFAAPIPIRVDFSPGTGTPEPSLNPSKIWTIRNNLLINTDAGSGLIVMTVLVNGDPPRDPMAFEQVFVEDFQTVAADDYQLFWNEQGASEIAPGPALASGYACPEDGMTNQECWDEYSRAYGGALMPGGASTQTWLVGGKSLEL